MHQNNTKATIYRDKVCGAAGKVSKEYLLV